jgi:hypothetical protein
VDKGLILPKSSPRVAIRLVAIALLLLLGLLCSELAAAMFVWSSAGRLPWLSAPTPATAIADFMADPARREETIRQFGADWVNNDLARGTINNHGFFGKA